MTVRAAYPTAVVTIGLAALGGAVALAGAFAPAGHDPDHLRSHVAASPLPETPGLPAAAAAGDERKDEGAAAQAAAMAHGVAHDPSAVASIGRWMGLGSPLGRSSVAVPPAPGARRQPAPLPVTKASPQAPAEGVDRVVTIRTRGSNLSFEPARLSLKAGTRVRLEYVNEGVLPHNFVLLKSEDDLDALGAAAYEAEATGYVPLEHRDQMIAWTALAAPGTTVSVTFEVPAPGTYTFVCLFPGHYNVMLGTLRALN